MIIPILYPSAAPFWLSPCTNDIIKNKPINTRKRVSIPRNHHIQTDQRLCQWISMQYGMNLPLDVLVLSANQRINNQWCKGRLLDRELVLDGMVHISRIRSDHDSGEKIYTLCVASPELCFLQAAGSLPMPELIKLGFDLCSIYCMDHTQEYHQVGREPPTDVARLIQYMEYHPGKNGVKRARRALRYVIDRSNSPMETRLAMIACLPLYKGGYALRKPVLNKMVDLSKHAVQIVGRDRLCCDMVWEEEKVIVEYDSNLTHLNEKQHARDKARITALSESGYTIICLTAESIWIHNIDKTFQAIRKALGMKARTGDLETYRAKRQEMVEKIMFDMQ